MGQRKNIYLDDGNLKKLNNVDNQSGLINNLLEEYFREDIDYLEEKKREFNEEIIKIELKIKQKKELAKVKAQEIKQEQRNTKLAEQKIKNENTQKAENYIFNYNLNPIFKKMVTNLLNFGYYNYKKVEYVNVNDFLQLLSEEFGTLEEPTDKFKLLTEEQKDYINKTGFLK